MKTWTICVCCALGTLTTIQGQVANNDFFTAPSGSAFSVAAPGVLTNDTGGSLTAVLVTGPANGTLTLNPNGSFTYTPANNFTGMDGFTYRASNGSQTSSPASVDIMVLAPGEVFFDNFSRPTNNGSIFPWIMVNDTHTIVSTWGITNNLMIGNGGAYTYGYAYYNNPTWTAYSVQCQMRFSANYAASAGLLGRLNPATGAHYAAWVYPEQSNENNIQPINGIPRLQLIKYEGWTNYTLFGSRVSLASVQTNWHSLKMAFQGSNVLVYFDGNLVINLTDNGTIDGKPAYTNGGMGLNMWTSIAPPAYRFSVSNLIVATTAIANNDSYLATNSLALTVPAPGILTNDVGAGSLTAILAAGPTNGTLTLTNNGGFVYTPTNNSGGFDSFTYRCADGQSTSAVATVTFTIIRSASASNDFYSAIVNMPLSVGQPGVLANDQSGIGPLTALLSSGPLNGSLILTNNGGFRYAPAANFGGTDSFTYRCTDGQTTSGVVTVTITIVSLPVLTVTADNQTRLYGANNPVWTASYSGFINGDSTNVLTGSPALSSSADTTSPIANYSITIGPGTLNATNYTFQFVNGTMAVTPAALTVTARNANKIYGQSLTFVGTEFTSLGLMNGNTITLVALASSGATASAGIAGSPYPINASNATGTGLSNYIISYFPGALTLNPASLTVTARGTNKIYGQSLTFTGTEFSSLGLVNGDSINQVSLSSSGAAAAATVAGSPYGITAGNATGTGLSNYNISYLPGTLIVNPTVVTASADDKSRIYSLANPTLTATFTGFVNNENTNVLSGAPVLSSSAGSASPIGTYAITIGPGTLSASNYSFYFVNGTLSVTPTTLTVTAGNASKVYGQVLSFAGTEFTSLGLVNGDSITQVSLSSSGAAATASVAGSPYGITAGNATGTGLSNYSVSYLPGTLAVNPAGLTVTADDKSRMYSLANPSLTATYTGFVNNENTNVLAGSPALSTTANPASSAGTYPITITQGTLSDVNYDFIFKEGMLTVTPAEAPVIISLGLTDQICTVTWSSVTNAAYELQYAAGLVNTNWTSVLPDVTAIGSTASQTNSIGVMPQQFYRVKLLTP